VNPDVARLEAERLQPSPKEHTASVDRLIRELVHVLACALGVGRRL
jgi:hypothetical protein